MVQQQFTNAKAFSDAITLRYGRSYHIYINKMRGDDRVRRMVADMERWTRDSVVEGGIERAYEQAAFGLERAMLRGVLNPQTMSAIRAMNVRQLCTLIYELKFFDWNVESYGSYLMQKFTQEIAS